MGNSTKAETPADVQAAQASAPDRVYGKFVCTELLGEGAVGEVWKAWDVQLSRYVALKFVKSDDDSVRERFLRESRIAALLSHPGIAAIYETGEAGGRHFIAMQLIAGSTLHDYGQGDARELARVIRDAARAVAFANDHGIIHRDLRPANIMIEDETSRVFVMDFGLARRLKEADGADDGGVVGRPHYRSPEQVRGDEVDPRSDVYALGSTLCAALTGCTGFDGDPFGEISAGAAAELETIVLKCLEKARRKRYADCHALADDLERYLSGDRIRARPPAGAVEIVKRPSRLKLLFKRAVPPTVVRVRRHRRVLTVTGVMLAGALLAHHLLIRMPTSHAARQDRELLRDVSAQKVAVERRFQELLDLRRYDEAILVAAEHEGHRPRVPDVQVPAILREQEFAGLRRDYAVSSARAYLARARARLAAKDERGRLDLASAYHTGHDKANGRVAARAALVDLAGYLLARGREKDAEATAQLAAARFGAGADIRAALARAMQQTGKLEAAASLWSSLTTDGNFTKEARRSLTLLRLLLPRVRLAAPRGAYVVRDLDGTGAPELVTLDGAELKIRLPSKEGWKDLASRSFPEGAGARYWLRVDDITGDSRPEIVVVATPPRRLYVFRWTGKRLELRHKIGLRHDVTELASFDVDGDGARELVLNTGRPEMAAVFYRFDGKSLQSWFRWSMGADIVDLRAVGPGELLVRLCEWEASTRERRSFRVGASGERVDELLDEAQPWGFRAFVLRRDESGVYHEVAASRRRFGKGWNFDAGGRAVWLYSWAPATMRRLVPDASEGYFRLDWNKGALSSRPAPRANARPVSRVLLGDKEHLLLCDADGRVHALAEGEKDGPTALCGPITRIQGGSRPRFTARAKDELVLYGLGHWSPQPPEVAARIKTRRGRLSPAQELLEIGLYAEAAELLKTTGKGARTRYDLGIALSNLRKWNEAAEAFGSAATDRRLALDARMRQAHALEQARDWKALVVCLEQLEQLPGGDAFARDWAQQRLAWARTAGAYKAQLEVSDWAAAKTLFSDNPLKARVDSGRLRIWNSSDRFDEAAGPVFGYGGGPLRVRIRFIASAVPQSGGIGVGLRCLGLDAGVHLAWHGTGATASPLATYRLTARTPLAPEIQRPFADNLLEPGTEYVLQLEYVDGLRRLFVDVLDSKGRRVGEAVALDLPTPLPRGTYLVGQPGVGGGSIWDPEGRSVVELRLVGVEIRHAAPDEAPEPSGAAQWAARAGGHLLAGRYEEADVAYAQAHAGSEDHPFLARIQLFRALAALRAGKTDLATRHTRDAALADRATVEAMLKARRAPALSADEATFFARELKR